MDCGEKNLFGWLINLKEHNPWPIDTRPDQYVDILSQKSTLNKGVEVTVWESQMDKLNIYCIFFSSAYKTYNPEVFDYFDKHTLIVATPTVRYIINDFSDTFTALLSYSDENIDYFVKENHR